MFQLAELSDTLRLPPSTLALSLHTAAAEHIRNIYTDRVVPQLGLAVALYDITKLGQALLRQGSPDHEVKAVFRLVIFRPYVGEVITGTCLSCSRETGIRVSMSFFDDIYIHTERFRENTEWSESESLWVWKVEGAELFYDLENRVRFRVVDVEFREQTVRSADELEGLAQNEKPAMKVVATVAEPGLGLVSWWPDPEEGG